MTADAAPLQRLLVVQDHDRTIDGLTHRRSTLPEFDDLARIDAELATVDTEASTVEEARHEIERKQKRLEDEVAMLEDRIVAEDAKLYGGEVTGVKELQALQDEIKGLKERQRLVEDQILDVMEAAEPLDAQLAALAQRRTVHDQDRSQVERSLVEAQADIDDELGEVEGQRVEAAAGLSQDLLDEYDRLRSTPGRIGVARLVGRRCHGCHLELSAVEVDRLKKLPADELVHCDECGCILVR